MKKKAATKPRKAKPIGKVKPKKKRRLKQKRDKADRGRETARQWPTHRLFNTYTDAMEDLRQMIGRAAAVLFDAHARLKHLKTTCPLCAAGDLGDLSGHLEKQHRAVNQQGWLKCRYCEYKASLSGLKDHYKAVHMAASDGKVDIRDLFDDR